MEDKNKIKVRENDFDAAFLEAHTSITRYRTACDVNAEMEYKKWQRKKNTQTTSS